jgi:hypothetical protein
MFATQDSFFCPAILLKVMAGDSYNIRVASGWNDGATSANSSSEVLNDLVLALSSGLPSASGGKVTQTHAVVSVLKHK